ncbi:FAD-dependent oxidoreductase [Actinophytocola xanthii]|uniref:FAD-dependent oxidoreductase n=1 Tax=Actinophytocola xanthii TaxID=1912961 RepID=A0A1Q8CAA9_9PSEU|nr:FAD-dependent oxidoreductase [Actinophytocola xanthii]
MTSSGQGDQNYDVVVVGNGALGQSLALTLARRGHRVAMVGRPNRPWAASAAAGAMLGCFGEITESLVASEYGRLKLNLDVHAARMWPSWAAQLAEESGGEDVRTAEGTVVILNTIGVPGIDDVNYAAIQAELRRHDEPFSDVDPADLEWLDPDPGARPLKAFHIPNEHAVNAAALLDQLHVAFVRAGGTVLPELATRVDYAHGRARGVVLESGSLVRGEHVVLAAGVRSQDLLATVPDVAATVPPLVSGYGVSALVRTGDGTAPGSVIRTPNRAFACGLHVVPRGQGEVYVGATNIISTDPVETAVIRDLDFLLDCAGAQVRRNLHNSGLHRVQVGNRPVALDGFPLLGEAGLSGLWMMTGTYRDGLHLSPLLAGEMARRILGEEPEFELDAFRPVRAPIQAATREEIVEGAVVHQLATGYECDWKVPINWPSLIEAQLRPAYLKLADDIDPTFTPPPELLDAARLQPTLVKMLRDYYAASRVSA